MKMKKMAMGLGLFGAALLTSVTMVFAADSETAKSAESEIQEENEVQEETYSLKFMVEGMEEELPANLHVGDGYSILIPKEGWTENGPDSWKSAYNDEVQIEVEHFVDCTLEMGMEKMAEDDYSAYENSEKNEDNENNERNVLHYQRTMGDYQQFWTLLEDGKDVWGVSYSYPDNPEISEGFGARLPVIAASFRLLEDSENLVPMYDEKLLSADGLAVAKVIVAFSNAYFNGDAGWIREFLTAPYEWDVEVRESTEEVSDVKIKYLENIPESKDGDTCMVSVQYVDSPKDDSYQYLSVELVKQGGEWKVSFYGIEK